MEDELRIDSSRSAAALEHPQSRRVLLKLVGNEMSLQELASSTSLSLSLLHYHVGRLQDLGLVRVLRVDKRSGRPVKRYRAVAKRFFVPFNLATDGASETLARELRAGLERDRARRDDAGIAYFVDASGPRMTRIRGSIKPCSFEAWVTLSLSPEAAEELAKEVRSLFARFADRDDLNRIQMIAYCGFAQRSGDPGR